MKLIKALLLDVIYGGLPLERRAPQTSGTCQEVIPWLTKWNTDARDFFNPYIVADWNNNVDITEANGEITNQKEKEFKEFARSRTEEAKIKFKTIIDVCKKDPADTDCCLTDELIPVTHGLHAHPILWTKERQIRAMDKILTYKIYGEQDMDSSSLDEADLEIYQANIGTMVTAYSTQKVISMDGSEKLSLEPDIYKILDTRAQSAAESSDDAVKSYQEMKYYWYNWHHNVGRVCKGPYEEFVEVSNKAAVENGYTDTGDSWRDWYEDPMFESTIDDIWKKLKPLYGKIYGHVRHTLNNVYGEEYVKGDKSPMPSHLMGNMWAQTWGSLYPLVEPFNKAGVRPDATPALKDLETIEMYEKAEEFFTSVGMWPMTQKFWDNSVIEKLDGVEMVCHASAWDFMDGSGMGDDGKTSDYRIKQCTSKTQSNFVTLHHEMGHIVYFQQYAHQPIIFRSGGNPGFHEAIGDTIALAVSTPSHLKKVGLLPGFDPANETPASDLNYLMQTALDKITFLPFGLLMDKYRWSVFSGETTPDKYQEKWDALRLEYQGLIPPVKRTSLDFDAAGKFHISNNVPYIRYFVSFIVQFQFYEKMCIKAGQYNPTDLTSKLYKCDFYTNMDAGSIMEKMMAEGNSQKWQTILNDFLCDDPNEPDCDGSMNPSSLMKYFQPLEEWLDEQAGYYGYEQTWDDVAWEPKGFNDIPTESTFEPSSTEVISLSLSLLFALFFL